MATTITAAQKQALIDNFQEEITERARKLRAQYNLQAQSLKTRLEMRVNRIPQALRKRIVGELLEEGANQSRPAPPSPPKPVPMPVASQRIPAAQPSSPKSRPAQAAKRKSEEISRLSSEDADKENEGLPNPKKRAKPTTNTTAPAAANSKAQRSLATTRKAAAPGTTNPAGVLSPRSNNSRTLPHPPAPFKTSNLSPEKSSIPRAGAASRAGARSALAKSQQASSDSGRTSESSNGTTVVRGKKPALKKTASSTSVGAKAAAAGRKAAATTTAAVGRTLRKRN